MQVYLHVSVTKMISVQVLQPDILLSCSAKCLDTMIDMITTIDMIAMVDMEVTPSCTWAKFLHIPGHRILRTFSANMGGE